MDATNLILAAVLPFVSDMTVKLGLAIMVPVTPAQVDQVSWRLHYVPEPDGAWPARITAWLSVQDITGSNRYTFEYERGAMRQFARGDASSPAGNVRVTKDEAIAMARTAINKMGYSLEDLHADFAPEVKPPFHGEGNAAPRYILAWHDPKTDLKGLTTVDAWIDAVNVRITRLSFHTHDLDGPDPPPLQELLNNVSPDSDGHKYWPRPFFASQKAQISEALLPQARRLAAHFDLAFPPSFNASDVSVKGEWGAGMVGAMMGKMALTNGLAFLFEGKTDGTNVEPVLQGFVCPGSFFFSGWDVRIRSFAGPAKISERDGIRIARDAILFLAPKADLSKRPEIRRPYHLPGKLHVPRISLYWLNGTVEVDLQTGAIKYLSVERNPMIL